MNIKIKEISTATNIVIPWLPDEIKMSSGGITFSTYSLLDYGEIVVPKGMGLQRVSWEGIFPGKKRQGTPYPAASSWLDSSVYEKLLKKWKDNKTPLRLTAGASISMDCYVENYDLTYNGGFGDVKYNITLVEMKSISVKVFVSKKKGAKTSTSRNTKALKTYTIKKGDCLYNIAKKHLGKGTRWKEIYNLNKTVIEKAAKSHKRKSSDNGHWIYPKTKLKLPKK